MGLDVYLYRFEAPIEKIDADDAEIEAFSTKAWDFGGRKYEDLTKAEIASARETVDAFYVRMGYVKNADSNFYHHPGEIRVPDAKSSKWPEHICSKTYLRSSYNENGLNSILRRLGLVDLYSVFDRGEDAPSRFVPDWTATRARAAELLAAYREIADGLDVIEVRDSFSPPRLGDEAEVLRFARKELAKKPPFDDFGGWSTSDGLFVPSGVNVVAIVRGRPGLLGTGVYYVTKRELTPETDWTGQGLEIVVEMCDYVLGEPGVFGLYWSA